MGVGKKQKRIVHGKVKSRYGSEIVVDSEISDKNRCWIFNYTNGQLEGSPPWLTKAQAKKLIAALSRFIKYGSQNDNR